MSQNASYGADGVLGVDSGIDALRTSPEFRGPVEPLEGHHCNDHLALIFESREEQFASIVPFVRQGLQRGERCMYVIDELSREGILASGALSFHTVEDTYLRNGTFEPDEMIEFYASTIEEATEEYDGLRIAAETTWLQEEGTTIEEFMEYEAKVNDLFEGEDCIAMCQYDRNAFSPEVIRDIIRTHPHLIYDGTVCHNFYHTPPEEFFGPDEAAREVDRMLGTLRDRTEAKAKLQEREQFLREQHDITARPDLDFEEKLQALFELGCERFDLELGGMARVDPDDDRFVIEYVSDDHEQFEPGVELPLSETYCTAAVDGGASVGVSRPAERGYANVHVREEFGIEAYLGTHVEIDGDLDRTFFFVSSEPREEPFTDDQHTFQQLMGQWIRYELERRRRERYLRESHEITADPDLDFEEKLTRLLDLARERMGLDAAGLSHLPEYDGEFLTEYAIGYGDDGTVDASDGIWTDPGEGCFCRQTIVDDEPVGMADVRGTDWEDDRIHREQGLTCYLGTRVTSGSVPYGTLWVGSTEPRDREFTETERTFLKLLGQWVSYELERREHNESQRELYEITADPELTTDEKIERLLEAGCGYLDLPVGMLTRERGDMFEIERMLGTHPDLDEGTLTPPLTENYCRRVVDTGDSISVGDAGAAGWEEDALYHEFGLECYAGTQVTVGDEPYGTICFTDLSPREGFTEAEQAFLDLMGQCVSYELEREHREAQLGALNAMGRDLMDAETRAEIADVAVEHARESLRLPLTTLVAYDEETGRIEPAAQTPRAADEIPTATLCERGEGALWDAFVTGEVRTVDDVASLPGAGEDVTGILAVPLGRQGLFVVGTRADDGFSAAERDFVEATAATVEAAFTRADREQQLHERERTLEEQNETLQRLDRINDIIRNIDQALVQASNRGEIEAVVCEQLADVGPYELAWIGEHDSVTGEVTPRQWAGVAKGYLEEVTITVDDDPTGRGPNGRAIRTYEPQVVNDILDDASFEPWRQAALNRGYHACMALPLVYEDTLYGVLNVYAGQPGVFDELERTVLSELSDNVAHAINAVESKKALVSDEVVELEFEVGDTDHPLVALTEEADCEVALEGLVPRTDGQLRAFVSTWGVPVEQVIETHPPALAPEVDLVSHGERDGEPACLFEVELTDESISGVVLEHGGVVREITAEGGTATVLVELSADAAVREFVEMFRTRYPDSELIAKRARERRRRTLTELHGALTEKLTPRQREVLQTAYFSGYFDQPRARTGSEIAESLDIAQPTFNSHLRAAQRKVCRELFERSLRS